MHQQLCDNYPNRNYQCRKAFNFNTQKGFVYKILKKQRIDPLLDNKDIILKKTIVANIICSCRLFRLEKSRAYVNRHD